MYSRAQLVLVVGDQHDDGDDARMRFIDIPAKCVCVYRTRSRRATVDCATTRVCIAAAQSQHNRTPSPMPPPSQSHQVQWNNRCTKRGRIQLFSQAASQSGCQRGQNAQNSRQIVDSPCSLLLCVCQLRAPIVQINAMQKVDKIIRKVKASIRRRRRDRQRDVVEMSVMTLTT